MTPSPGVLSPVASTGLRHLTTVHPRRLSCSVPPHCVPELFCPSSLCLTSIAVLSHLQSLAPLARRHMPLRSRCPLRHFRGRQSIRLSINCSHTLTHVHRRTYMHAPTHTRTDTYTEDPPPELHVISEGVRNNIGYL